jgi:hypothetical protein
MTTDDKFRLDKIREQRDKAKNSYEKRYYSTQMRLLLKGLCPICKKK